MMSRVVAAAQPRLLVCNSLPKSGSTWTYFCLRHALNNLGYADAIKNRDQLGLRVNDWGNPGTLTAPLVDAFIAQGKTYLIKSHSERLPELQRYLDSGQLRVAYLIRHPYDIVASALDHGKADRQAGQTDSPYHSLSNVADALRFLQTFWPMASSWWPTASSTPAHITRYEHMLSSYVSHIASLLAYLIPEYPHERRHAAAAAAVAAYDMKASNTDHLPHSPVHLRFNVGRAGRYNTCFNQEQREEIREQLADTCRAFGYDPD